MLLLTLMACCLGAMAAEFTPDPLTSTADWTTTGARVNYSLGTTSLRVSGDRPEGADGALELHYDFSTRRWWVGMQWLGDSIPGRTAALPFHLRGDGSGHIPAVRILDAAGYSYETRLAPLDWEGWREVSVPLSDRRWRHVRRRGEDRRPPAFPVKVDCICLYRSPEGPETGSVAIARLVAQTDAQAVDCAVLRATPGAPSGLFYAPQEVCLAAAATNPTDEHLRGTLALDVTDFFGATRREYEADVELPPGGSVEREITFEEGRPGYYDARLSFRVDGSEVGLPLRFGVTGAHDQGPVDRASPFGINAIGLPPGPQRERALQLGEEAGIRWERVGFHFDRLQPSRESFAWTPPSRVPGPRGRAVEFDTGRLPFQVESTSALNAPCRSGQLTIAARLRLKALDFGGEWQILLQKLAGGPERRQFMLFWRNSTRQLALSCGDGKSRWTDMFCTKTDWEPGRWYHVAVTHQRSGPARWYVDGQPAGEAEAGCETLVSNDAPLSIGPQGQISYAIDDLRLYDRILSPEEVAAAAAGDTAPPGPVAAYGFDEQDESLTDSVGASHGRLGQLPVDDLIRDAAAHGVSVLGIVGFAPPWASTAPEGEPRAGFYEPRPEAFESFCRELAARYRGRVDHWEVWNEPNISVFWEPEPDAAAYARTLAAGYRGLKAGNPDCTVIGVSLAGGGKLRQRFVEEVLAAGGGRSMDLLSLHPYRYPATPEETDLAGDMRHAFDLGESHGGGKRLWLTEIGWPAHSDPQGSTEAWEALMLPRSFIESLAGGVVDKVFWFRFHNPGWDPSYLEHQCGLLRNDLSPKPAYFAYRSMALTLAGQSMQRRLGTGGPTRAYLFEGETGRTVALWSPEGSAPVLIAPSTDDLRAVDIMGNAQPLRPTGECLLVQADEAVRYLTAVPENVQVRQAAVVEGEPTVTLGRSATVPALFRNPSAADLDLTLAVTAHSGLDCRAPAEVRVPAGGEVAVQLSLAPTSDPAPGRYAVSLSMTGTAGTARLDIPVLVTRVERDAPPVALYRFDGSAKDASGHRHDAQLRGGAKRSHDGRVGGCLELTDSASRAEVADGPALAAGDEVSLMCWVRTSGANGQWQAPIMKAEGERVRNYGLYVGRDSGELHFTTTYEDMGQGHTDPGSGTVVWDGQWHHLAATFSAYARRLRLYVDGKLVAEHGVDQGPLLPATAPLVLGAGMGGAREGESRPPACLDEVAIFARELTEEVVAAAAAR